MDEDAKRMGYENCQDAPDRGMFRTCWSDPQDLRFVLVILSLFVLHALMCILLVLQLCLLSPAIHQLML